MALRNSLMRTMMLATALMITTSCSNSKAIGTEDPVSQKKRVFKRDIAKGLETDDTPIEAIFILPPAGTKDTAARRQTRELIDAFEKNKIPCFLIGDTAGYRLADVENTVGAIQAQHRFNAVTVLAIGHGDLIDRETRQVVRDDLPETIARRDTMLAHRFGSSDMHSIWTRALMRGISDTAQAARIDYVSFSCHGGHVWQSQVDKLPKGSAFVSLCGGDEFGRFKPVENLAKAMKTGKTRAKKSVAATDMLVEILAENMREFNGTVVVGVSGAEEILQVKAPNNYFAYDPRYTASSKAQLTTLYRFTQEKSQTKQAQDFAGRQPE